jgi:hypothetical protein
LPTYTHTHQGEPVPIPIPGPYPPAGRSSSHTHIHTHMGNGYPRVSHTRGFCIQKIKIQHSTEIQNINIRTAGKELRCSVRVCFLMGFLGLLLNGLFVVRFLPLIGYGVNGDGFLVTIPIPVIPDRYEFFPVCIPMGTKSYPNPGP